MGKARSKTKTKSEAPREGSSRCRIFTLQVELCGGPVTEKFLNENPEVIRTIEMRGDQTLEDLHCAIFEAFDREEEHLYEFQVGGKRPQDRNATRYVVECAAQDCWDAEPPMLASETTLDSLALKPRDVFFYWFDFGDDWWHRIKVLGIEEKPLDRRKKHPCVTARVGQSPPQYPDWDEEEEW